MSTKLKVMQGNGVRSRAVFRDVDGELLDPNTVTCKLRSPDGIETAFVYETDEEVDRLSEGVYIMWFATPLPEEYTVRWVGVDGAGNIIADEAPVEVEASAFVDP